MKLEKIGIVSVLFVLANFSMANCSTLLYEDFQSTLANWTGKGGGAYYGIIVDDPLDNSNKVLSFVGLNNEGDIFSTSSFLSLDGQFTLSFDYLGLRSSSVSSGNLGGYIGYSFGLPGDHVWLAGTALAGGALADPLIDDGFWHHYVISFTVTSATAPIHLMLEDWIGAFGVPGDAFFDNIRLDGTNPVPEPATMLLFGVGITGVAGYTYRKKAKK